MTDQETIEAMLDRAKIKYEEGALPLWSDYDNRPDGAVILTVEGGYSGFVSVLTFHPDGRLFNVEAFE